MDMEKHLRFVVTRDSAERFLEILEKKPQECEGEIETMVVNGSQAPYRNGFDEEREWLFVCFHEQEAKQMAEWFPLTPEQQKHVICLEGYVGKHYFHNCIRSLQPLEKSLLQILNMLFVFGVVNLDYYDFQQMVRGTENFINSFYDETERVKAMLDYFLSCNKAQDCLVNLFGDFDMRDAMDIGDIVGRYENALLGAAPEDTQSGKMGIMVIYNA